MANDRRKIQEPPTCSEYERNCDWVNTLERFRLGEAILDQSGLMAAELTVCFQEQWFRDPLHRAAFRAIKALVGRGARDLDVGMVIAELQAQGTFQEFVHATSYVCSLTESVVPPPSRESRRFRLEEMHRGWQTLLRARQEAKREH